MGVGLVVNFALYGFLFVLGLYFQRTHGLNPQETGLAFLPLSIAVGFANILAGWLMARIGPRALMTAGLIVAAAGFVLLTGVDARTSYLVLTPSFLLISCGIGSAVPAMTTTLLAAAGKAEAGVASGALNMIRQAAGAVGVALFGAIGGHSEHSMSGLRATFWLAAAVLVAGAAIAALRAGERRPDRG
jgi:DHA2 family methylenomycin A resistance protein-like MFS transporter